MISAESRAVAERARQLYQSRLREEMEQEHQGRYLCIEWMTQAVATDEPDGLRRAATCLLSASGSGRAQALRS